MLSYFTSDISLVGLDANDPAHQLCGDIQRMNVICETVLVGVEALYALRII
jgi:hypothetical protein